MPDIRAELVLEPALPLIELVPEQGIQTIIDKVYLWNPDVANTLLIKINELLEKLQKPVSYDDLIDKPLLDTSSSLPLQPTDGETIQHTISLHKISKTGSYEDLVNKPEIVTPEELQAETEARIAGDEALDAKISAEQQARQAGDAALGTRIDNEITRATDAESDLSDRITANADAISAEITAREQADDTLQDNIDTVSDNLEAETQNRTDADNALSGRITTNENAIADIIGELNTYGDIVTHDVDEFATAAQGAKADTAIQPNDNVSELTNDATYQTQAQVNTSIATHNTSTTAHQDIRTVVNGKQDTLTAGDNIDITGGVISATDTTYTAGNGLTLTGTEFSANVINNTGSDSTTDALSAAAGKSLQEQVNNLLGRGKYLSIWDCTTGLAMDEPPVNPYTIETGSYFIVGKVGTTNYRPNGGVYDKDVPSTTIETGSVKINDTYFYDGTQWRLLATPEKEVSFSALAGSPYDNTNLASALNGKQATINDLTTIRNNASAGKSASDTIAGYGDVVTHDADEFATSAQGSKADTALQPGDNISDLTNDSNYQTQAQVNTAISTHNTSSTAHNDIRTTLGEKADEADLQAHIDDKANPHEVTKTQVGLGNVDNTSDLNKPISTATQSALDLKADDSDLQAHVADTDNPHGVTKAQVGLGNVDNTSDANKPVSTATQTALNTKQDVISDLDEIRSGAEAGSTAVQPGDLATVATTGSYNDLINKPTIPAAQVNSDWNATSGVAEILNKPTIPTKTSDLTNDSGFITSSYHDATKQDVISDLSTIRSNASAGKSASDTIATYGNIVTHNASEFATSAQGALADSALQSGDNVSELTNDAGYITSAYHDNTKQDVISDLSTIRSGATAGSTAIQPDDNISELTNDANYQNGSQVTASISAHNTSTSAHSDIRSAISAKQDQLTAGTNVDITDNVISATDTKYTAGNGLTLTGTQFSANVVDNITSTSTTNALSANMGKELQDQINNLKQRGRYLSIWNCTTGLAETTPTVDPYEYKAGDYFIVGVVGTTNYRPSGSTYSESTPSTVVETGDVKVNDTYYYDGTTWTLLDIGQVASTFASLGGSPYDNANLASALNDKADTDDLATVAITGSYDDLSNKPTIPAAQVPADWNATTGVSRILNKPTIPTVPTNVSAFTNDANYQTGTQVSSAISTHNSSSSAHSSLFDAKQNTITGGATTITSNNLTTNRALVSDGSGKVAVSAVTSTELGYLDGVTSAIQTQLNSKQATISDLATIRSGATLGATAAQPADVTSAISTHNSSSSAHSDIRSAVASKSTVSVSATGTATDEVQYITIDGVQKKLAGGSGGGSEEDNLSITKNASDKIQTVGVIDQNDTTRAVKEWFGTRDEYEAIASKDNDTEYTITDDSDLSMPILQALYPVGASFITFNETCPLANLFGTWQKVGTKILVDVNSTVPVVGNGMTLGFTNGTSNVGLYCGSGTTNVQIAKNMYGQPVGYSASGTNITELASFGVTTDGTKSGIIADLSSAKTEMTINIFRRTA